MLFCSRSCTRGCCGVPSELPYETERTNSVYREMAADFVKYSFYPVVVVHCVPSRSTIFVQVACFPITQGTLQGRLSEHSMVTRTYLLEMYDETTSNRNWRGEYFTLKSLQNSTLRANEIVDRNRKSYIKRVKTVSYLFAAFCLSKERTERKGKIQETGELSFSL